MSDCCCIELDTPQSIYEEGNDYYDAGTDIFDEIFDNLPEGTTLENETVMIQALWWKWRFYILSGCDTEKWVQAMTDRLCLVGPKWDAIITKSSAEDVDLTNLEDRAYHRVIKRTPVEGTDGDVRTLSHEGDITVKNEHETLPQTETTTTKYLDSRVENTTTNGQTDTDTFTPNTQDEETYQADDSLTAVTFASMMNNYPNVILGFVNEFSDYFVNRWY